MLLFVANIAWADNACQLSDEESQKAKLLLNAIFKTVDATHYTGVALNDEYSERVYNLFLKKLDYQKRFFTQEDLADFERYKHKIDDLIKNESFDFFEMVNNRLNDRIAASKEIYQSILAQPFDYTDGGVFETNPEKRDFAIDENDRPNKWEKVLEYAVVSRMATKIKEQEEALEKGDTEVEQKDKETLEVEAREKVLKNYDSWFSRLEKVENIDRLGSYFNAMVQAYDPHSSYFLPKKKEDFDIRISGKLEGIGATLQEKDGYITVTKIVPGSPSYLQGELEATDKILKVGQGDEEPVDVVDMRLDEAVRLIRGKKGTVVRLSVKKKDGSQKVIPITRDIVVLEETFAKSALLEKEENNYGYIYLPRFYADFKNKKNGRHCSDDIRKELIKLKKENIEGLVFDLRSNGGGSLSDVVKMAGLFIEEGPIVQVKEKNERIKSHSDTDKSVVYNGPLVVLVDNFSASASEILAAALQDYDRAIIVGSNATYGKGTVQRFYDLDRAVVGQSDMKPLGSVKVTTQKFYRINGGTTQLKGVTPDVILPDEFSYIEKVGEKELDYVMGWDEIPASKYSEWDELPDSRKVAKWSKSRLKKDEVFKQIDENAERIGNFEDDTDFSLDLDVYLNELCEREEQAAKIKDLAQPISGLDVMPIESDWASIEGDSLKVELTEKWHEDLQKDVYINEAISILNDIL